MDKTERKSKFTDAERHKRFVDMAREVEASNDPKEFEKAFKKVVKAKSVPPPITPKHRDHEK